MQRETPYDLAMLRESQPRDTEGPDFKLSRPSFSHFASGQLDEVRELSVICIMVLHFNAFTNETNKCGFVMTTSAKARFL